MQDKDHNSTTGTGHATPSRDDANGVTRWLDSEEQVAWRTYLFTTYLLLEELSRTLESDPEVDLTLAEYEILVRLSEADGHAVRMSLLADAVVHSRSRLTHTVGRLEKRGLVERQRCAADGRGRIARMTPAGMDLLRRAAPAHVQSVRSLLLDRLGRERFLQLGDLMADLVPEGSEPTPPPNPEVDPDC